MQMRPPIQVQSIIKAMTDTVLPALDPQNKLAQEQARLVIGILQVMSRQMPLQYRFDTDELARLLQLSRVLAEQSQGGGVQTREAVEALSIAASAAGHVLDGARTTPEALEESVRTMKAATGAVVTAAFRDGGDTIRERVQSTILAASKEQLLRDRAWVIAQGWEPDPAAVPPIETLLGPPHPGTGG